MQIEAEATVPMLKTQYATPIRQLKQIGIDNPTLGWCCPNTRRWNRGRWNRSSKTKSTAMMRDENFNEFVGRESIRMGRQLAVIPQADCTRAHQQRSYAQKAQQRRYKPC